MASLDPGTFTCTLSVRTPIHSATTLWRYKDPTVVITAVHAMDRSQIPSQARTMGISVTPKKNEEVELPQTWGSTPVQPKVGRAVF